MAPVSTPVNSLRIFLYIPNMYPISLPPTPMSPAMCTNRQIQKTLPSLIHETSGTRTVTVDVKLVVQCV